MNLCRNAALNLIEELARHGLPALLDVLNKRRMIICQTVTMALLVSVHRCAQLSCLTWSLTNSIASASAQEPRDDVDREETIAALKNFRSELLSRIVHNLSALEQAKDCVAVCEVSSDGSIGSIAIVPSGDKRQADAKIKESIKSAFPMGKLPDHIEQITARVKLGADPSISTETPESARLFRQGAALLDSANFPGAIARLTKALDIAGDDCQKYRSLLSQSFVSYALFLPANSKEVAAQLYRSLHFNANNDAARQQLNELLASKGVNPGDCKVRLALARKAVRERNMQMAAVELAEAKRLAADDQATTGDITELEELVSSYNETHYWQEFLQKHPDSFDGHLGLGLAWQHCNKIESAANEYRAALNLNPHSAYARSLFNQVETNDHNE